MEQAAGQVRKAEGVREARSEESSSERARSRAVTTEEKLLEAVLPLSNALQQNPHQQQQQQQQ